MDKLVFVDIDLGDLELHVFRVPTAYELLMQGDGKSAVIIGDVTDINEALHPTIVSMETERL